MMWLSCTWKCMMEKQQSRQGESFLLLMVTAEMMDHVHLSTDSRGTLLLLEIQKQEADPLEAFAHLLEGDF